MKGNLIIVSGMSGSGKTTIMRKVMGEGAEIVSVTTRPQREGEIEGKDYYFVDDDMFELMDRTGLLAEKSTYYGRASYGVTKAEIDSKLEKGNAYIIVDFNGMQQLLEHYENAITIFIHAPESVCRWNMVSRGDSIDNVVNRLETYYEELENRGFYDYSVRSVPGQLVKMYKVIDSIIEAEGSFYRQMEELKNNDDLMLQFEREYESEWVGGKGE